VLLHGAARQRFVTIAAFGRAAKEGFISIGASNPASRLFRAKARERIVALAAAGDLTVPLARTFAFEDAREGRGYAGSPAPERQAGMVLDA
jgi:NADPH:quinone reductase